MLVYDEMVPRHFWGMAIVTGVLPSRDSEVRGIIATMAKTNTILKRPVSKLFTNPLIRFNKTCEIISIVTRVLYILLTIAATTVSVERVYSKERV